MITQFKIFENNIPKYKIGDTVFTLSKPYSEIDIYKPCIITKIIIPQRDNIIKYMLDRYPDVILREDFIISDYELTAKKYNL